MALRALFATLLHPQPDAEPAATASPAADGREPREAAPVQRLLTGPSPGSASDKPRTGVALQQSGFFDPPDPTLGGGNRTLGVGDFIARFHDAMRRAGVTAREPLQPVLVLLGEMLLHFSRLQADQVAASQHITKAFTAGMHEEGARAQAVIAEESRGVAAAMADCASRVEAGVGAIKLAREDVRNGFSSDVEAALRAYTWNRTRRDRVITTAAWVIVVLAVAGSCIEYEHYSDQQEMALTIQTLKQPILDAAMRDGPEIAKVWRRIMEANHYGELVKTCKPQAYGTGYRLACTIAVWVGAPPIEPPPS